MKQIIGLISFIFSFFLVLLLFLWFLFFTSYGNRILAPFSQTMLNAALPFQVEVKSLHIDYKNIKSTIQIEESLNLTINGKHKFFTFDLDLVGFTNENLKLFNAKILGNLKKFMIVLKEARGSDFSVNLQSEFNFFKARHINLNIKNLDSAFFAELFKLKNDFKGRINSKLIYKNENLVFNINSIDFLFNEISLPFNINGATKQNKTKIKMNFALINTPLQAILTSNDIKKFNNTEITFFKQDSSFATLLLKKKNQFEFLLLENDLHFIGAFENTNGFRFNVESSNLNGNLNIAFRNHNMTFNASNLRINDILDSFGLLNIASGMININGNYNFKLNIGKLLATSPKIQLNLNNLEFQDLNNNEQYELKVESKINQTNFSNHIKIFDEDKLIYESNDLDLKDLF